MQWTLSQRKDQVTNHQKIPVIPEPDLIEATQAFVTHWKAKNKLADKRKKRGFISPASQSSKLNLKDASSPPDKTESKCADCKQKGHWKGDKICPKVQAGLTPEYVPKEKQDRKKKKPPETNHMVHPVNAVKPATLGCYHPLCPYMTKGHWMNDEYPVRPPKSKPPGGGSPGAATPAFPPGNWTRPNPKGRTVRRTSSSQAGKRAEEQSELGIYGQQCREGGTNRRTKSSS